MHFTSEEIFESIRTIWARTLSLDIEPAAADQWTGETRSIAASIRITGGWNGALLLECPAELARTAAAVLFDIPPADVRSADMQDAVVELVELIGNQIKSRSPSGGRLSLRATLENNSWSGIRGDWPVAHAVFRCQGQQAMIAVVEEIGQRAMALAA